MNFLYCEMYSVEPPRRKSSALSDLFSFLDNIDFQFESPYWLLFPGVGSVLLAALCGFLMYCQMLEAKPQGTLIQKC